MLHNHMRKSESIIQMRQSQYIEEREIPVSDRLIKPHHGVGILIILGLQQTTLASDHKLTHLFKESESLVIKRLPPCQGRA